MTTVVNLRKEPCDVKICRRPDGTIPDSPGIGYFGNPFHLKNTQDDMEREKVVAQYKEYFYEKIKDETFRNAVLSLKGKRLGCFCKPKACHGDIIKEWLDANS